MKCKTSIKITNTLLKIRYITHNQLVSPVIKYTPKTVKFSIYRIRSILLCKRMSLYQPNTPLTIKYVPRSFGLDYRR